MKLLLLMGVLFSLDVFAQTWQVPNTYVVGRNGSTATSATTYTEVVQYGPTNGKNFYVNGFTIEAKLSTPSATVSSLGTCSLQIPRGTSVATFNLINPSTGAMERVDFMPHGPLFVKSGNSIVGSCTPQNSTSTVYNINLVGYEL